MECLLLFCCRYYNYLYTHWVSGTARNTVDQTQNCEDILMNFLVTHATRLPPIKLTGRKQFKDSMIGANAKTRSVWAEAEHFAQRQICMNIFVEVFGYMPLVRSRVRMDPVLYKDPVSMTRKKYKQIEVVKE